MAQRTGTKRYNLVLPESLFDEVQKIAEERQVTVVDLLRKFIKLGLLALEIEDSPDKALLIRDGNTERQLLMLT